MSQNTIQPIKITPRFSKLFPLAFSSFLGFIQIEIIKMQSVPRKRSSIQCYALTRILVRLVNPTFSKYGGSSSTEFLEVLLIYCMLNARILLCSTKCVLLGGDLRLMRILYLKETKVECLQICKLNSKFQGHTYYQPQIINLKRRPPLRISFLVKSI